jgi:hypothetical protein
VVLRELVSGLGFKQQRGAQELGFLFMYSSSGISYGYQIVDVLEGSRRWPEARAPVEGHRRWPGAGALVDGCSCKPRPVSSIWPTTSLSTGTCVRAAADGSCAAAATVYSGELPNLSLRATMEDVLNIQALFVNYKNEKWPRQLIRVLIFS